MSWGFYNPVKLIFGAGKIKDISLFVYGTPLIVTTPGATRRGLTGAVRDLLCQSAPVIFDRVQPNPDIKQIETALLELQKRSIGSIIALGGGSSMDFAKALSFCLANPDTSLRQQLKSGNALNNADMLPLVTVPTTAGSGSEVTPFATIWDISEHKKYSLFGEKLFANVTILDPELTCSLTWEQTLSPGLDALSQSFESIWNKHSTPVTTQLSLRAIQQIPGSLRVLKEQPNNLAARSAMLESSLFAGLAISQTRTGLAHSISYPLTAHFGLPHGIACSFTLPAIWEKAAEYNLQWANGIAQTLFRQSAEELKSEILSLYFDLNTKEIFQNYIADFKSIYPLTSEMLTPGRSDNMIFPVSQELVGHLLRRTEELLFRS